MGAERDHELHSQKEKGTHFIKIGRSCVYTRDAGVRRVVS